MEFTSHMVLDRNHMMNPLRRFILSFDATRYAPLIDMIRASPLNNSSVMFILEACVLMHFPVLLLAVGAFSVSGIGSEYKIAGIFYISKQVCFVAFQFFYLHAER